MSEKVSPTAPSAEELAWGFDITAPDESVPMMEIAVAGDLCPVGRAEELLSSGQTTALWGEIDNDLQIADLSIANLECPLTHCRNSIAKTGPKLASSPVWAEQIQAAGFDVLSLANNHILDMGQEGLADTLKACTAAGLSTVGAGADLEEACRPLFVSIKGIRIAILALAENEFSIASAGTAGACPLDVIQNYRQIQVARANADFVLIVLHGGNEYYSLPRPGMVQTCNFFVDCGAHAVVCHHSHVASGVQVYRNAPIIYSTGNFLFDQAKKPRVWHAGYIVKLSVQPKAVVSLRLIPYLQFWDTPGIRHMEEDEKTLFLQEIERLSQVIVHPSSLESEWQAFCRRRQSDYASMLFSRCRTEGRLFRRVPLLWRSWLTGSRVNVVLNLIRCESHRDALIEALAQEYGAE